MCLKSQTTSAKEKKEKHEHQNSNSKYSNSNKNDYANNNIDRIDETRGYVFDVK
jgi:hypothetical protein